MKEEGIVRTMRAMRVSLKKKQQRKVGPGPGYSNDVRKVTGLTPIATESKINSHSTVGINFAPCNN